MSGEGNDSPDEVRDGGEIKDGEFKDGGEIKDGGDVVVENRHVLANYQSTARDHLANERTFLAWVRTALGIMGLGVILEKLVETEGTAATAASLVLVGYGALLLVYSLYRYERVGTHLRDGQFPVARRGPALIAVLALVVMVGAVVLILH